MHTFLVSNIYFFYYTSLHQFQIYSSTTTQPLNHPIHDCVHVLSAVLTSAVHTRARLVRGDHRWAANALRCGAASATIAFAAALGYYFMMTQMDGLYQLW